LNSPEAHKSSTKIGGQVHYTRFSLEKVNKAGKPENDLSLLKLPSSLWRASLEKSLYK
jgi:hypothetical protein